MKIMRPSLALLATCGIALLSAAAARPGVQDPDLDYSTGTIDLGVVVGDLEASVEFYTQLVGFSEVPGFSVGGELCASAGLTDGHALRVRVLSLPAEERATKLKLMQLPEAKPHKADNAFVHTQLGYSYITLYTNGLTPILARLEEAGVEPVAEGPVPLPGADADGPHLAVVRDPDGNLVELLGPLR